MTELALRFRVEASMAEAKASLDQGAAAFRKFGADANAAMGQASKGYTGMVAGMERNTAITGNVAAQFNDIGVMLAAGQNPFQLAIQQGTQLSQVLAQTGGGIRGAAAALRAGFMAMLSPTTLLTIAVIAGGAALVQWAFSAHGSADAAKEAADATEAYGKTLSALESEFNAAKSLHGEYVEAVKQGNADLIRSIELEARARQALFALERIEQAAAAAAAVQAQATYKAALEATRNEQLAMIDAIAKTREAQANEGGAVAGSALADQLEIQQGELTIITGLLVKQRAELDKSSAEYAVINAQVESLNAKIKVNGDLVNIVKNGLAGAADGADRVASANMAGNIAAAIGPAQQLLGIMTYVANAMNAAVTARRTAMDPTSAGYLANQYSMYGQGHAASDAATDPLFNPPSVPRISAGGGGGSSGGGGGSSSNPLSDLSAQAQKAMADMDLAIAAINEKVKVGLLSTAEAGDAITSAREKAANDIAMLIAELDRLGPAGKAAADALRISLTTMTADLQGPINDLAKSLSEGLTDPLKDFMKGTKTASEAFQAMGDNIISKLIDIAMQQAQMEFFTPLISGLFGGMGGGGLGGSIMSAFGLAHGGMVSGPGTGTSDSIPARLSNGEFVVNAAATAKNKSLLRAINAGQEVSALDRQMSAASVGAGRSSSAPVTTNVKQTVIITPPAGQEARVTERQSGNENIVEVMFEMIDNKMAESARSGRGAHVNALADTFGLSRRTR